MKKIVPFITIIFLMFFLLSCDDASTSGSAVSESGSIVQETDSTDPETGSTVSEGVSTVQETDSTDSETDSTVSEGVYTDQETDSTDPETGSTVSEGVSTVQESTGNSYPIVLVHGFSGWGRDEVAGPYGHYYWGGYNDIQEILKEAGHDCYTGVVGPFSSNWDRACELYAQLTGTRTDYGLAHSVKNNHDRFGRDFSGKPLVPQWDKTNKIHIISHSQGGQTSRMLAQLLEQGFTDEMNADYSGHEPISPLFDKNQDTTALICSITTMATPHDGTTLANGMIKIIPFMQELILRTVQQLGVDVNGTAFNFYDFKMQHFGLTTRQPGETVEEYFARTNASIDSLLEGENKDTSLWDLSPEGAEELNDWVHAQQNIYYLSYSDEATHRDSFRTVKDNNEYHQVSDTNMFVAFIPMGYMMGAYTCNDPRYEGPFRALDGEFYNMPVSERVPIDSSWWQNDGVVNTKSMDGPTLFTPGYSGEKDVIVNWDGVSSPQKGIWNHGGVLANVDHFDIIGLELGSFDMDAHNNTLFDHIEDWYVDLAQLLESL